MAEKKHPIVYRGSVKDIRCVSEPGRRSPGRYLFEFTDDYSVFDYGKMPDPIRGKGAALALMTGYLLEELERPETWKRLLRKGKMWDRLGDGLRKRLRKSRAGSRVMKEGLKTHYIGMLDDKGKCVKYGRLNAPTRRMLVKAVPVVPPKPLSLGNRVLWDYSELRQGLPMYLIPLENIFRFGLPRGSSLLRRLARDPAYGAELGLDGIPSEGDWLQEPVLEFSSKLEPMDRYLPLESALNFSGLEGGRFLELRDLSLLVAVFLYGLFLEKGLELWDGKFEFIKVRDEILLADAITPDELRITLNGEQLSKEPLRQYYKKYDKAFCRTMDSLKKDGPGSGSVSTAVKKELGRPPNRLDPRFRSIIEQMYQSLAYTITGSPLLAGAMELEEVLEGIKGFIG